ncbi:wax ester/triacylglycerol synthase domain-containing protein [Actinomadura rubrisoli]|uniref:diacylglycerol O-acyltransferase n=1 Tax=Actinomadura rubrisoli TaxID=2530368 RepID=A0A4R5CEY6_9ACTN|nr:wax ester/triacylglycerol synthase domain-containing protein [Actinomadura rubrisoli]TDD98145.1 DUF1298 domain-containing protein [Actinomadura rubrisoli]
MRPSRAFGVGAWRLPQRMNTLDTLMWRCRADPRLHSPLVCLILLDRTPDWECWAATHDWVTRMLPRLRQRAVAPLLPSGLGRWETDPGFDLGRHLWRTRLPGPGGRRQLLDLVQMVTATPFDEGRPPWDSVLVEDVRWEDGAPGAAWILKVHHCVSDGPTLGFWLTRVLGRTAEPDPDRPQPPPMPPRPPAGLLRPIGLPGAPLPGPAALVRPAREVWRAARRPRRTVMETIRAVRTIGELMPRRVGEPSALLENRGTARRPAVLSMPLDPMRAAARLAQCSVNDAFIAALLGGFRHYHERHGAVMDSLSIAMPISLRRADSPRTGNRFGGIRFTGPMAEPDPRARMVAVRDSIAAASAAFAPGGLDVLLNALNRLPTPVVTDLVARLGNSYDLQASQVAGIYRPSYMAGAAVTDAYCFGPVPGCAVMALLLVHRDKCSIAFTLDSAAVTDTDSFMRSMDTAFHEVMETARNAGGTGAREKS